MPPSLSLDAASRARAPERESLGRTSVFGRERRRCLQRRQPGGSASTATTSTSTFALFYYLADSALDDPSLAQFAVGEEFLEFGASDLTSSVERILSSAGANSSSPLSASNFSSSNFPPTSIAAIFDTADLASPAGAVLNFLLHHPVSNRKAEATPSREGAGKKASRQRTNASKLLNKS